MRTVQMIVNYRKNQEKFRWMKNFHNYRDTTTTIHRCPHSGRKRVKGFSVPGALWSHIWSFMSKTLIFCISNENGPN